MCFPRHCRQRGTLTAVDVNVAHRLGTPSPISRASLLAFSSAYPRAILFCTCRFFDVFHAPLR